VSGTPSRGRPAERHSRWGAEPIPVAVVSGSGLATVPDGYRVEDEQAYGEVGWPATDVAGHPNRLLVARSPHGERAFLACGRPHPYEGWSGEALERPLSDLALWGVRTVVLTCAAGGLTEAAAPGTLVVVDEVVDLQSPHAGGEPSLLAATAPALAARAVGALRSHVPAVRGRYAAVWGPQYETPAEAAWLAGLADVVGMSGAPEVRAARYLGLTAVMVAAVVNRSSGAMDHEEVLAAGARLQSNLQAALASLMAAVRSEGPGGGAQSRELG
jgi:purine-nucleoside phosphorylase